MGPAPSTSNPSSPTLGWRSRSGTPSSIARAGGTKARNSSGGERGGKLHGNLLEVRSATTLGGRHIHGIYARTRRLNHWRYTRSPPCSKAVRSRLQVSGQSCCTTYGGDARPAIRFGDGPPRAQPSRATDRGVRGGRAGDAERGSGTPDVSGSGARACGVAATLDKLSDLDSRRGSADLGRRAHRRGRGAGSSAAPCWLPQIAWMRSSRVKPTRRPLGTRNSSVERRARLLLVDAVRQRARRGRPARRLRSATLDRRVVGM